MVLKRHQKLLLTDTASTMLIKQIEQYMKGDDPKQRVRASSLEVYLFLLHRSQRIGVVATWIHFVMGRIAAEQIPHEPTALGILQAFEDLFLCKDTWNKKLGILENQQGLLLTDTARMLLTSIIEEIERIGDPELGKAANYMKAHQALLQLVSKFGIIATRKIIFDQERQLKLSSKPSEDPLFKTLTTWLQIRTYLEERRFLEEHLELLEPRTEDFLNDMIAWGIHSDKVVERENWVQRCQMALSLLQDARRRGGTMEAIRSACVNMRGGLVLDLPPWLEEIQLQLEHLN